MDKILNDLAGNLAQAASFATTIMERDTTLPIVPLSVETIPQYS